MEKLFGDRNYHQFIAGIIFSFFNGESFRNEFSLFLDKFLVT